jgi:hypothetical protein
VATEKEVREYREPRTVRREERKGMDEARRAFAALPYYAQRALFLELHDLLNGEKNDA